MTVLDIDHAPGGYVLIQSPYDEIIKSHYDAMPGFRWSKQDRAYVAPLEAARIVLATLKKARTAKFDQSLLKHPHAKYEAPRHKLDLTDLREYQKDGARFIVDTVSTYGSALLADDMGLGKSLQALRAARCLKPDARMLIVCPAVVTGHWIEQAQKWLGEPAVRLTAKSAEWDGIATVSYDTLRSIGKSKTPMPMAGLIVLDEIHYLSNSKSQRSAIVSHYVNTCRKTHSAPIIGTSGTPMNTRIRDLWHPLNVLFPGRFGTWWKFTERYCDGSYEEIKAIEKQVWRSDGSSNLDELNERLRAVMLRRERHAVGELPPRTRVTIPVDLPGAIVKQLQRAAASLHGEHGLSKLLGNVELWKLNATVELARDIIEQGGKVLIFTVRRDTARQLSETLKLPYVTGAVPAHKRKKILTDGALHCNGAVATMFSVPTGIDLYDFNTAIFVGLDYVPSTMLQAEARIHRIGQTLPVTVYFMIGLRTVDEVIRSTVVERLGYYERVLGDAAAAEMSADLSGSEEEIIKSIVQMVREMK